MVETAKQDLVKRLGQWGKRYRYPMLILVLGVFLMLLPSRKSQTQPQVEAVLTDTREEFDLEGFTEATETLLAGISGAGRVQVLYTLSDDGKRSYLYDETSRRQEGQSEQETQTVLIKQGSDEAPLTVSRVYPAFRGAVVTCQGAGDPQVALGIKEAISSLTGLGMDKITVLKMD